MADSFFGFDASLADSNLEDGTDCSMLPEDELGEEEEYDALNDETFGSEATIGDWEKDHEKLAQITESSRPHHKTASNKKNGTNTDIEDSLAHLVLDETEGIVPRPGVWDSPSLSTSQTWQSPSLPSSLKNVCTVEELERGLIANRPPPGLSKPSHTPQQPQPQQLQKADGTLLFEALSLNDKLPINGLPPPRFPPGLAIPGPPSLIIPPNMRLPHPQFMQHPRLFPNQPGNVLRYTLPPHLMLTHGAQRQQIHGAFCNNFPQPPHPNLGPPLFLRPDHPMMPAFPGKQNNIQQQQPQQQQHSFPHGVNQRNQNRPFHHNDQQTNHQPFFKNNQYPHRNQDRSTQQRNCHYQHYSQGMNGMNNSSEYDEYAGLMSSRERQWLINIQLLQLHTNQPYVDDYYYTVFCDRQNKQNAKQDQQDKKPESTNGSHRDSRDREQPQQHLTRVKYVPTQFENSLGKLQFSSVTAPRKLIDMDVVPNNDPQSTPQFQQKDTKRTRQLLLEIERLYTIQLKLEDLSNPLALLTDQSSQETENEKDSVEKTEPELISMMLTSILQLIQDDKLSSILSIRKGKTLLLRFLPHLSISEYSSQLVELWTGIFRGLAVIGRRDSHLLTNFYPEFKKWVDAIKDFSIILRLAKALSDSANQPIKNNSLGFAVANQFGVSVIAAILERAEDMCSTEESVPSEWSSFVVTVVETIGDSSPCVYPCQPISESKLYLHLKRISVLTVERYNVLELLLNYLNPKV